MPGYTPTYNLPYPLSSDLVSAYPALGQDLAEDLDTALAAKASLSGATYTGTHNFTGATVTGIASGLALISAQTVASASSVSVNGCFTSTYANYRIVLANVTADANRTMNIRWRVSGSDNSTTNYSYQYGYDSSTTVTGSRSTGQSNGVIGYASTTTGSFYIIDVLGPQLATDTTAMSLGMYVYSGGPDSIRLTNRFAAATQFDSFSIIASAGTIAATSLRVYGYSN